MVQPARIVVGGLVGGIVGVGVLDRQTRSSATLANTLFGPGIPWDHEWVPMAYHQLL